MIAVFVLLHSREYHRRIFAESFALLIGMIATNTAMFVIILLVAIRLEKYWQVMRTSSLFSMILLIAVFTGIILYHLLKMVQRKLDWPITAMTLVEYYIQWTLIYITIYQVLFNDFVKSSQKMLRVAQDSMVINPDLLVIALCPSLISTWIAIVLYKFYRKEI